MTPSKNDPFVNNELTIERVLGVEGQNKKK
jgi:hypothetical protein